MYRCSLIRLLLVLITIQLGDGHKTHLKSFSTKKGNLESEMFADARPAEKRSIIQFGIMILCTTGRQALAYNNYGNYCGIGGSGTPVDNIDRCCKAHDKCYRRNKHCSYYWLLYDSGFIKRWRSSSQKCVIKCDDSERCKFNICECDRIAAECFAKYRYNPKHKKSWWGRRRR